MGAIAALMSDINCLDIKVALKDLAFTLVFCPKAIMLVLLR